ncbi:PDZ domain-containing protein [bacterium]|nr:PDZ domain-containing protein [bacterium]
MTNCTVSTSRSGESTEQRPLSFLFGNLFLLIALFSVSPYSTARGHSFENVAPELRGATEAQYVLDMTTADRRLFTVEATFPNRPGRATTLRLPVWSPGSYLIREYAKNVVDLEAYDAKGRPLEVVQTAKDRWDVRHDRRTDLTVRYQVYGSAQSVRTPFIDSNRAGWTPTALFVTPLHEELRDWSIRTVLPEGWEAEMCTEHAPEENGTLFRGSGLDEFYDAAGIAGPLDRYSFEVHGVPHELVFDGPGNYDIEELLPKVRQVCETTEAAFRGDRSLNEDGSSPVLPLERYVILVSMSYKHGGLEHLHGTHLIWPRHEFATEKDVQDFLSLVAHEYFHLWNIKRIRPEPLGPFDYQSENYTRNLWVVEGITSYYDLLLPARAGTWTMEHLLGWFDKLHDRVAYRHGPKVMSLDNSSLTAWIKYYRRDENSMNTEISYYTKGALVSLLLDMEIRMRTDGRKSLDDVMRTLWSGYESKRGAYGEEDGFADAVREATGLDLDEWLHHHVRTTAPLDFNPWLERVGLEFKPPEKPKPWLGVEWKSTDDGRIWLETVHWNMPADEAGLSNLDELLAVNGYRVTPKNYRDMLERLQPGGTAVLDIARDGKMMGSFEVVVAEDPAAPKLQPIKEPTPAQAAAFQAWCGLEHPNG